MPAISARNNLFILIVLLLNLTVAGMIRIESLPTLEGQHVLDPDSARYLRQAKIIAQDGKMPERDMMRWVPIGVQRGDRLTFFPTLVAVLHQFLTFFYPSLTIEKVAIFSPILFSLLSGLALYLLLNQVLDRETSLLGVNIALIAYPWVRRTIAGYADRDALTLFFSLISFYFYLRSCQAVRWKNQIVFALLSGSVMALLGLTWEGVGLMSTVIIGMELVQAVSFKYEKPDVYRYLSWVTPLLLGLTLFTNTYRDLSKPFALIALGVPVLFLPIALMHPLLDRFARFSRVITFNYLLPKGLSLILWLVICGSILVLPFIVWTRFPVSTLAGMWDNFLSPFGKSRLAAHISELLKFGTTGWFTWPGIFFGFTIAGMIGFMKRFAAGLNLNIALSLVLFEILLAGTILTRVLSGWIWAQETPLTYSFYLISISVFIAGMGILFVKAYGKHIRAEISSRTRCFDRNSLFLLVWFILMMFAARGAKRFEFFFVPVVSVAGGYAFVQLLRRIARDTDFPKLFFSVMFVLLGWEFVAMETDIITFLAKLAGNSTNHTANLVITICWTVICMGFAFWQIYKKSRFKRCVSQCLMLTGLVTSLVFLVGFSPFRQLPSYTRISFTQTGSNYKFITPAMHRAFEWMETHIPQSGVIAASWEHGSFLNLYANRATIIDAEPIPYWVYLMNRHLMLGQTEEEALEFLKTHRVTHLLITQRDINLLPTLSELGSDETYDRRCTIFRFGEHVETILTEPVSGSFYRYLIPGLKAKVDEPLQLGERIYPSGAWQVSSVYLQVKHQGQSFPELESVLVELDIGERVLRLRPEKLFFNGQWIRQEGNVLPCTLLIHAPSNNPSGWKILYLSQRARQSLMIRLYLFNESSKFFTPIYPPTNGPSMNYEARLWEISYPPDVKPNPKYLLTQFPDSKLYRSWMKGEN